MNLGLPVFGLDRIQPTRPAKGLKSGGEPRRAAGILVATDSEPRLLATAGAGTRFAASDPTPRVAAQLPLFARVVPCTADLVTTAAQGTVRGGTSKMKTPPGVVHVREVRTVVSGAHFRNGDPVTPRLSRGVESPDGTGKGAFAPRLKCSIARTAIWHKPRTPMLVRSRYTVPATKWSSPLRVESGSMAIRTVVRAAPRASAKDELAADPAFRTPARLGGRERTKRRACAKAASGMRELCTRVARS